MSTLEIRDLHVSVATEAGEKKILNGVDLTIRSGETHAIMGPNGSGKSTLAYSIAGHPKYTITSGSVTLDGEDLLGLTVDQRARAGFFSPCSTRFRCRLLRANFLRTARPRSTLRPQAAPLGQGRQRRHGPGRDEHLAQRKRQ